MAPPDDTAPDCIDDERRGGRGREEDDCEYPVNKFLAEQWKTPRDELDNLPADEKAALNALKKWLNANDVGVWWHDGNSDVCSRFPGAHLHVVYKSIQGSLGQYLSINDQNSFRALRKAVKAIGGYARTQGIQDLTAAVNYFNTPPRLFLGTKLKDLLKLRRSLVQKGFTWQLNSPAPWSTEVGDDDSDPGDDLRTGGKRLRGDLSSSDDEMLGPSTSQLRAKSPRSERGDLDDSPEYHRTYTTPPDAIVLPRNSGRTPSYLDGVDERSAGVAKLTSQDMKSRVVEKLMRHFHAFDYQSIGRCISECTDLTHRERCERTWQKLVTRGIKPTVERVRDNLATEWINSSLVEMSLKFLKSGQAKDQKYLSIQRSCDLFFDWCTWNALSFDVVVRNVCRTLNRQNGKQNTLRLQGPKNGGKTRVFVKPLQTLIPFAAHITNAGNSSQFLWMDCPGMRCVFIEECQFSPENVQTAKKILGGEMCFVDQKGVKAARCHPLPVILTGNINPFQMVQNPLDLDALIERCIFWEIRSWPVLSQVALEVNPGMWYFLGKLVEDLPEDTRIDGRHLTDFVYESMEEALDLSDNEEIL